MCLISTLEREKLGMWTIVQRAFCIICLNRPRFNHQQWLVSWAHEKISLAQIQEWLLSITRCDSTTCQSKSEQNMDKLRGHSNMLPTSGSVIFIHFLNSVTTTIYLKFPPSPSSANFQWFGQSFLLMFVYISIFSMFR